LDSFRENPPGPVGHDCGSTGARPRLPATRCSRC
jgi:hypothetical protein